MNPDQFSKILADKAIETLNSDTIKNWNTDTIKELAHKMAADLVSMLAKDSPADFAELIAEAEVEGMQEWIIQVVGDQLEKSLQILAPPEVY